MRSQFLSDVLTHRTLPASRALTDTDCPHLLRTTEKEVSPALTDTDCPHLLRTSEIQICHRQDPTGLGCQSGAPSAPHVWGRGTLEAVCLYA